MEKLVSTARMKDSLQKYVSNRREKIPGMPRNKIKKRFKYPENLFPLTGIARVSEKKRKKWFRQASKSVTTSKNKIAFQKLDFPVSTSSKKKSLNKRIMFKLNRKLVSTGRNGETFKKTFLLEGKTTSIDRNIWNIKENGCH